MKMVKLSIVIVTESILISSILNLGYFLFIPTPFTPSLKALRDLWLTLKCCAQHNKDPTLFTLGAVAMNIHFQTLVELKGGAPVVVLYGEPDVGKTTIANAAMSIAGIEACSFRGMRREFLFT